MLPSTFSLTPTSSAMSVQCVSLNITNDQVRETEESFFLAVASSTYIEAPGFPLQVVIEDDDGMLICLVVLLVLAVVLFLLVVAVVVLFLLLLLLLFLLLLLAVVTHSPHMLLLHFSQQQQYKSSRSQFHEMCMILFSFPTRCPSVLSANRILSS